MPLGIDSKPEARFGDRAFLADTGDDIGEHASFGDMIENVIDGEERRSCVLAQFGKHAQAPRLIAAMEVDASEKTASRRPLCQLGQAVNEEGSRSRGRHRDQHLPFAHTENVFESEFAFALLALEIAYRKKPAKPPIGFAVGRISEHFETVVRDEPGSDEKPERPFLRPLWARTMPASCCDRQCRWR